MCYATTVHAESPSLRAFLLIGFVGLVLVTSGCKKDDSPTEAPPNNTSHIPHGVFVESFNGGSSWSGIDSLLFAKNLYGGSFTNTSSNFVIVGQDTADKAAIWTSTDNGFNWLPAFTGTSGAFEDVTLRSNGRLVAVSDDGTICSSDNNGLSWNVRYATGPGLKAVDFFSAVNVGVTVGLSGRILRSSDGGTNWTAVNSGTTQDLFAVHCFKDASTDTIFAVGAAATVVLSTDGGLTWSASTLPSATILKAVSFTNNSIDRLGVTVGNGGVIFRTTNGGTTWENRTDIVSGNHEDVVVSNDGTKCLKVFNQTAPHTAFVAASTDRGSFWGNSRSVNNAYLFKFVPRDASLSSYIFAVGIPNY